MPRERDFTLVVQCKMCGKDHELKVYEEDYREYTSSNRRHIQEIFPYLTPAERELLISFTCEECWHKMFDDFE